MTLEQIQICIEGLTHKEIVIFREKLIDEGMLKLPRCLYYDYDKQVWID